MFDSLRLNTKLIGSVTAVAVMAGLLSWASYSGLDTAQNQLRSLFAQSQKQRLAASVNANFQLAVSKAKNFAILKDDSNRGKVLAYLKASQDDFQQLQPLADSDAEKEVFASMGAGIAAVAPRLQALLDTAKAGDRAESLYTQHLKDITAPFDKAIGSYVTALDERVGRELDEKIRQTKWALGFCLVLVLAGLALNLTVALSVSKSLEEVISAIDESVGQVAAGSTQVASASQQLAEGASETSSSLEETSSSMEEMASMTRQNSESASKASELMEETRGLILRGSDSVTGSLRSMQEMNESAQKVSRIIKTIEEIAFQTNLLALNAAVEAARAGEHGRGFSVVAEEVRNLASRSGAAAKDTAALIEENARRASQGMQVSEEASRSLAAMVESSAKASTVVGDIASASQEQARGITEINGAISAMDQVTQRVTANAEELSSASEEMSGQAEILREMVQRLVRLVEGDQALALQRQASWKPKAGRTAPAAGHPAWALPTKPQPAAPKQLAAF